MTGAVSTFGRWLVLAAGLFMVFGFSFVETEIVSSALGEVRPEGEVMRIQAPRSGRLLAWPIGAHEVVRAGTVLARLDVTLPAARRAALDAVLGEKRAELSRLSALLAEFEALADVHSQLPLDASHAAARQLEQAIRKRTALEHQQAEQELARAQTRARDLAERQRWLDQRCEAERRVFAKGGLPAQDVWQAELDCGAGLREQREARTAVTLAHLALARGSAVEAERRRQLFWQWRSALHEAEAEVLRLAAEREVLLAELRDSVLIAPIDGQFEPAAILHAGTYVQGGELLAQLVPLRVLPMVSAQLPESERNGVAVGQAVRIRISALPWTRYGVLPGRVQGIAAEAAPVEGGTPLFKVAVQPEGHPLVQELRPGMQVTVDFLRGREALWRWALRPLQETWLTALREP